MELKQLKTKNYPNNSIVIGWKTSPHKVMLEVNAELDKFGLKVVEYDTCNDNFCFVIARTETTKNKELKTTIFYDLEALKDKFIMNNKKDFNYHFNLLKGNLKDFFKKYV